MKSSERINSRATSLTRCLILSLLIYFADGLQYRELKAALNISDGKLISNLNQLEKFSYIKKSTIKFDNRKLTVYSITNIGTREVKKMTEWMGLMIQVVQSGEKFERGL